MFRQAFRRALSPGGYMYLERMVREYAGFTRDKGVRVSAANLVASASRHVLGRGEHDPYLHWLEINRIRPAELEEMAVSAADGGTGSTFLMIVMASGRKGSDERVGLTLGSLYSQAYPYWTAKVVGGSSGRDHGSDKVSRLDAPQDPADAINNMMAEDDSDYVALVREGERLPPESLFVMAREIANHPRTDLIYSDDDRMDRDGSRGDPRFKPDWSPDTVLSTNYVGNLALFRRERLVETGGFRAGTGSAMQYDAVLRMSELPGWKVRHVPRVLFHRGPGPDGPGDRSRSKSAVKVVQDALDRRGVAARVFAGRESGACRIHYRLSGPRDVDIILPTGGRVDLLDTCVRSIFARTTFKDFVIHLVDNSTADDVREWYEGLDSNCAKKVRYLEWREKPFNYPALITQGMVSSSAPNVLLLNDDTEVVTPDWIEQLLMHARRREVGAVGCKLLFPPPADMYQHAGVVMGLFNLTGHAHRFVPADSGGIDDSANMVRNYSAVTGACMMFRRELWDEVDGMDGFNLPVEFNDVDFCLKLLEKGYWNVYTPHAVLYHHEALTKDPPRNIEERNFIRKRWGHVIDHDPFYNPNLSRVSEDFSIRRYPDPFLKVFDPERKTGP